jgi:hypothetical protein
MLQRLPFISCWDLDCYVDSIRSKLCIYNDLKGAPAMLKLAIWKSKIVKQTDGNINLSQCQHDDGMSNRFSIHGCHYRSVCAVRPNR